MQFTTHQLKLCTLSTYSSTKEKYCEVITAKPKQELPKPCGFIPLKKAQIGMKAEITFKSKSHTLRHLDEIPPCLRVHQHCKPKHTVEADNLKSKRLAQFSYYYYSNHSFEVVYFGVAL